MMTDKEFILRHEHEMIGWVVDAMCCGLTGDLRSMRLRELTVKIRERLRVIYQELTARPQVNGKAAEGPARQA
jgi:hypothetical protein